MLGLACAQLPKQASRIVGFVTDEGFNLVGSGHHCHSGCMYHIKLHLEADEGRAVPPSEGVLTLSTPL